MCVSRWPGHRRVMSEEKFQMGCGLQGSVGWHLASELRKFCAINRRLKLKRVAIDHQQLSALNSS